MLGSLLDDANGYSSASESEGASKDGADIDNNGAKKSKTSDNMVFVVNQSNDSADYDDGSLVNNFDDFLKQSGKNCKNIITIIIFLLGFLRTSKNFLRKSNNFLRNSKNTWQNNHKLGCRLPRHIRLKAHLGMARTAGSTYQQPIGSIS